MPLRKLPREDLTDQSIMDLAPPEKGRIEHFDKKVGGLSIRVTDKGHRSFAFTASALRNGRRVTARFTLGPYKGRGDASAPANALTLPAARRKAADLKKLVHDGFDPTAAERATEAQRRDESLNTFRRVMESFIEAREMEMRSTTSEGEKRGIRPRTLAEYRRVLLGNEKKTRGRKQLESGHPFAAFRDRPLASLTSADIRSVLDTIKRRGAMISANRTLVYLRTALKWAVQNEKIRKNPADRVEKPLKGAEKPRKRVLRDSELRALWLETLREENGVTTPIKAYRWTGAVLRLLILTGQRTNEIAGLRWAECHELDNPTAAHIELPGARTKNKHEHIIPLAPLAASIIRAQKRDGEYVFTGKIGGHVSHFSATKARLDAAIHDFPPWQIRDLRRTWNTVLNQLGESFYILDIALNHVTNEAKRGIRGGL